MNAIPCTPRHEKQDDTFASWENLPAGVMASLSQRTVRLDWCSSWWCHCRWCTQMGQRASEAGSEEKDDWQGQDAERQLSGWHWQTAGEEIAKKFCGRNYALNFTALQGCNMSTWRWTWGRYSSVNEGWQDRVFFFRFLFHKKTHDDQCKICLHDSGGKPWVNLNLHITSLPEIDQSRVAMAGKNIICAAKLATRALLRNVFLLPLFTFLHFASLRPYQNHFQCNLDLGS